MTYELFWEPRPQVISGAVISDDEVYRYRLWRIWEPLRHPMVWLMLNPSTADAKADDPTIRRCMQFAKREGCGGIQVLNLYALRATHPENLLNHPDPEGPDNVKHWEQVIEHAGPSVRVIAGWGAGLDRVVRSRGLPAALGFFRFAPWMCLGTTKDGHPRHPLYVKGDAPMVPWNVAL